ncbi:MAG: insulinase family protein, partial [Candidatus Omnitrophica bacterium]|nr:insulinase family protein [Candidatus Omnitrophota bacterium]
MFIILFPLTLNIRAQGTDDNYMVLDNGLVVLMRPGPGSGLVCLMALVEAGSTTEAEYLGSGISHFVEHMLFKGTPSRGVGVIPAQVKSYGGDMNAWTSFDSTGYRIVVLKEYLRSAAEVLADALQNPLFDPIELEKERQVILREINLNQDDPDRRISRLLFSSAYEKHFYKYPVIGYKDIFEKLTRDNLVNYHQRLYRPDNIVLALTGDFDPRTAREYIKNIFGKWSKAANAPVLAVSPEPVQSAMRKVINTAAVQTCYLEIGFHGPALRNEDLFPMDVLAHILGGDKESRIYKLLVDKKQLASSVNCWSYTPKDKGLFGFDIRFTQNKNLDRIVEVILNQINRVIKKGVKSKEIKRAQRQILSDYVWGLETAVNQARDMCSSYVLTQNPDFFQTYIEGINNVTSKGIVKAAKKYLRSDNLTQVSIIPRTDIPEKLKPALEKSRKKQARQLLTRLADIRAGFNVKDEGKNKIFSKREILKVV